MGDNPHYRTREYREARKALAAELRRNGSLTCVQSICLEPSRTITPDHGFDVAHDDAGQVILGAAHPRCNRADGGRRRHDPLAGRAPSDGPRRNGRSGGTRAKRECLICGTIYTPSHSKQATCGRTCGQQMVALGIQPTPVPAKIRHQCPTCGIHFPHTGTARTYCENCGPPSAEIIRQRSIDVRECDQCGATFEQRGRGRRRRFCLACSPVGGPYLDLTKRTRREKI